MNVIYCAGEEGRVVLDTLRRQRTNDRIVFIDDDPTLAGATVDGVEVIGTGDKLYEFDPDRDRCIVAFGDELDTRLELTERVREAGLDLFTVIDPDATVSDRATIDEGTVVTAQTFVGPGASLGESVLLDSAVTVSHDATLRRGVTVGPNATIAGGVEIGKNAYVGAGATVLDDRTIGRRAVIGAGAVVIDDVPAETTAVGVPATPVSDRQDETGQE